MKARTDFAGLVREVVLSLGGRPDPRTGDAAGLVIDTTAGPLHLSPRSSVVYGKFAEPSRARDVRWANTYTGKWNHHYGAGAGTEEADDFRRRLALVLPQESP